MALHKPSAPARGGWLPLATLVMAVACSLVLPLAHHAGEVGPLLFMVLIGLLGLAGTLVALQQQRTRWAAANALAGLGLVPLVLLATAVVGG